MAAVRDVVKLVFKSTQWPKSVQSPFTGPCGPADEGDELAAGAESRCAARQPSR